jgi:hypothetical protein
MKKLTFLIISYLWLSALFAQEDYSRSLGDISWVRIESKADIIVKTHSAAGILIKADKKIASPEKAKGLKLVGNGEQANTEIGYYVIKEGNDLIVRNLRKDETAEIYLPANQNISVRSKWNGNINISGFTGEVEASAELNGHIRIRDISGPLTANTLNGEVNVDFNNVNQKSPITIATTNGEMDITLPAATPANIKLGSINGEIYTNFELNTPAKDGLKAIATKNVEGSINNGGVTISIKSVNGNIYLRKG